MKEQIPTWLGITCVVLMFGIAVFAFLGMRQGLKIKPRKDGSNSVSDAISLNRDSNMHH